MPILDIDGNDISRVLATMLRRGVSDAEIAEALGIPASTYAQRKKAADFPQHRELADIAAGLGVCDFLLLIDFGYMRADALNDTLRAIHAKYRQAVAALDELAELCTSQRVTPAGQREVRMRETTVRIKSGAE